MTEHLRVDGEASRVLIELGDVCRSALDGLRDFSRRTLWSPDPEVRSPRRLEAQRLARKAGPSGTWDGRDADRAGDMAILLLPVAGQYLAGMSSLLRSHEIMFPLAPVVRSLLELCGRVSWLLDPRLENVRLRSARLYLIRIEDLAKAKRLAYALGQHKGGTKIGQAHRDLRKRELRQRFFPSEIVISKSGKLSVAGQDLPGLRESVRILDEVHGEPWNAGGMYDFLASASHPTMHIVVEMLDRDSIQGAAKDAANGVGPNEARPINFRLDDMTYPRALARNGVITFLRTWQLAASYHGLTAPEADDVFRRVDLL